jgi:hypothetical protein
LLLQALHFPCQFHHLPIQNSASST